MGPGPDGGEPAARLHSLTGLRFVAAFLVFVAHSAESFRAGDTTDLRAPWRFLFLGGVGVSFFFVLSGFVLTWSHCEGDRPSAF